MTTETLTSTGAFELVYAEHFPRVRRFLTAQCGDFHLAEDLAQGVFTDLWRMVSEGKDLAEIERVWPFLKTMAKRALGAHWGLQRTQRETLLQVFDDHGTDGKDDVESLADAGQQSADIAEQVVERVALAAQLNALPPRQRAAMVRHVVEDLEFRDAARAEGVSTGYLQRLFAAAVAQLREANGVTYDAEQVENERRELARKMFFAAYNAGRPLSLGTLGEHFGRSHSWAVRTIGEESKFVQQESAASRVRNGLMAALMAGSFAPGQRLMSNPLAEQFDTTNGTIIRELRALADQGALERRTVPELRKGYAYFVPATVPQQQAPAPVTTLRMAA